MVAYATPDSAAATDIALFGVGGAVRVSLDMLKVVIVLTVAGLTMYQYGQQLLFLLLSKGLPLASQHPLADASTKAFCWPQLTCQQMLPPKARRRMW